MTKVNAKEGLPTAQGRTETAMEKTTRAVKEIQDAEAVERADKAARLRKARLESDDSSSEKTTGSKSS
ncbi:hypothetical protein N9E38_02420 [Yoonia sp.]|nr:hypothetical protein [Yoonia sp.]MDC1399166.1 hypothetical protein [Yoonia sp.]